MAAINGGDILTNGELPEVGAQLAEFDVCDTGWQDIPISSFAGTRVISLFPSVDTAVCAASVRRFNELGAQIDGVTVINLSQDLPPSLKRFCGAAGLEGVVVVSGYRSDAADKLGVRMTSGKLKGLMARAVLVVDGGGKVLYRQLVPTLGQEPDYDAALAVARG